MKSLKCTCDVKKQKERPRERAKVLKVIRKQRKPAIESSKEGKLEGRTDMNRTRSSMQTQTKKGFRNVKETFGEAETKVETSQ